MTRKIIDTRFDTQLTWDYRVHNNTLENLYERSKKAQWNAATASAELVGRRQAVLIGSGPGMNRRLAEFSGQGRR